MRSLARLAVACATLSLLLSAAAAPAAGPLRRNGDGTVTDLGTGLVWVADRGFAVRSGFARSAVLPRAEAVRLVAAMNAGEIENFGRTAWRLPTQRELLRIAVLTGAPLRLRGSQRAPAAGDVAWPVIGASVLSGFDGVAVLATNSIHIGRESQVAGDVVVNDASPGPTLKPGFELVIERGSTVAGDVGADSVLLERGAAAGEVDYNTLQNQGASTGPLTTPLALPVYALLPQFQTAALRPAADDVFVAAGQTRTLAAGDYDDIQIASGGTLVFAGGTYNVRSLLASGGNGTCGASPCRTVAFAAATDLRIAERLGTNAFARFGPADDATVSASEVIVYVGGVDGPDRVPPAAAFGRGSTLEANVYAPNGTIVLEQNTTATGALLGRDVLLDRNVAVTLDSYFANRAPAADPRDVSTAGAAPLVIGLSGSDPDGDDLTFAVVSGPTQGSLGPIVQDPPPTPTPRPVTAGLQAAPQAVVSTETASVTYTPATAGNVADSFTFQVTDPLGATGVATIRINPGDTAEVPKPPATTVVAFDGAESTTTGRAVTVTLDGDAPAGVALSFALVAGSGPANGTLGALVAGSEAPQRTASVLYTPASGFDGADGFDFTACGTIAGSPVCDTGHAAITVSPASVDPADLAPDKTAETSEDRPLEITLGGLSSASGASRMTSAAGALVFAAEPAAFLDSAEIAGNVADATGDGLGDNHNALPGAAPALVSAGVGLSGGAGSNGTLRIHIEWDISSLGTANLESAVVVLNTHRGTIDSLDTRFFAGGGGNGTLEDGDFESDLEPVRGAVMPVPPLEAMAVGSDGTFSFDVKSQLLAAKAAGATFFTVQGRVDESLTGAARGLEVYSTASGNIANFRQPQLSIATPGVFAPTVFRITSLPLSGILKDSLGATITGVPATLLDARVSYVPNASFVGTETFTYEAELGDTLDLGLVTIHVRAGNCALDPSYCDDGR